ncbi:MAG: hypothetical protein JWL72_4404 [Ilumatobacteraceae bacterium]|nr:hypothetical protein [Ilumatobacteraceae bacterium]MCU1394034.1 hypothetical protein [Ilumatobacteraceae bacterium]
MSGEEWSALMQGIDHQVAEVAARPPTTECPDQTSLLDAWSAPAFADLRSMEPIRELSLR